MSNRASVGITHGHGRRVSGAWLAALLVGLAVGATVGCVDEQTVFRDRDVFNPPADQTFNFLGYFDQAEKLTACGNCHVGQQAEWEGTAHADAWAGLLLAGDPPQAFCTGCHTVSQEGNAIDEAAGYNLTQAEQYQDVQCESCHGPGFDHVQNPDATQPLAPASVGVDLTTGCGECHAGEHHPFVEEWLESPHSGVITFAAAREECAGCHRGQSTLQAWGENANYIEKFEDEPLPVVCAVCHDPHDARNEGQLRFPVNTTSIDEHLCARCHDRRTAPDPASSHGLAPHAPESALLIGDAGWFPPNSQIDQGEIRGTHGSAANERLCATCHLPMFEVADPETNDFLFATTGHLFRPIPCVDAEGIPLPFEESCELTVEARAWEACTGGGCHGDEVAAKSALVDRAVPSITRWADSLEALLTTVDPNLDAEGGVIDPFDPTFDVAEGALFNLNLARAGSAEFGTNTVIGSAAHNPFLVEALLIASIDAVLAEHFSPSPAQTAALKAELDRVLSKLPK